MAISLIQDMGDTVLIDKDGIRSVVPRGLYEQLLAQEGVGTDQASTRNLPSMEPATITPVAPAPTAPTPVGAPPIAPEIPGSPRQQEEFSITPVPEAPATPTPPPTAPEAAVPTPVVPPEEEEMVFEEDEVEPIISGKAMTREEYNIALKKGQLTQEQINEETARIQREDAEKVLAIQEEENKKRIEAERQRAEDLAWESEERRRLYEDRKLAVEEFANTEIKEGDWFTKGTTMSLILAGIGNIASLRGARGQTGARPQLNMGLDIINKAIERDLNIQMANLSKKGKTATERGNLIAEFRGVTGDSESAYNLAEATAKTAVKRRIDLVAARSQDARIKNQLEQASLDLQKDIDAKLMDNAAKETLEKLNERKERRQMYQARTGRMGLGLEQEKFEHKKEQDALARQAAANAAAAEKKYADMDNIVGAVDENGNPIRVKDSKDRENIRAIIGPTQENINSARKIRYLLTKEGRAFYGLSKEEAKAEAAKMATGMMSASKGPASEQDLKFLLGEMGIDMSDPLNPVILQKTNTSIKLVEAYIVRAKRTANTRLKNTTGNQSLRFEEFNPIDLSAKPKPPKSEVGIDTVVDDLQKQKQERKDGKSFTDTPEAERKQQRRETARNQKIIKVVSDVWEEVDSAYGTEVDKQVAQRKAAQLERLLAEMDPTDPAQKIPRHYIMVEIKKLRDYIKDPSIRRKQVTEEKKKKEKEEKLEKRRKEREKRPLGFQGGGRMY